MEDLRRLVIAVFAVSFSITISILVMINGWGLTVKSWCWVIGVYFIGHTIAFLLSKLAEKK